MMTIIKAVAGAVASFAAEVAFVLLDDAVSLDEINVLWLAFIPILTALGVYVAPRNRPS